MKCPDAGIGRQARLRVVCTKCVRVRLPFWAHQFNLNFFFIKRLRFFFLLPLYYEFRLD